MAANAQADTTLKKTEKPSHFTMQQQNNTTTHTSSYSPNFRYLCITEQQHTDHLKHFYTERYEYTQNKDTAKYHHKGIVFGNDGYNTLDGLGPKRPNHRIGTTNRGCGSAVSGAVQCKRRTLQFQSPVV